MITELGADHDDSVKPVTAVDCDRRINRILNKVGAETAHNGGNLAVGIDCPRFGEREGAHGEFVVPALTIQCQRADVMEDNKAVVAFAAIDGWWIG